MSSTLEELFSQAATKCNELGDGVDAAGEEIARIVSHSRELDASVKSGAAEIRSGLRALTDRLERAESEIGDVAKGAEDALGSSIEEAGEARAALQQLSERGGNGSSELDATVERVSGSLTTSLQAASQAFNDYGEAVAGFSQSTAEHVGGTQRALEAFANEVDEARDDLEAKKEGWLKALDALTGTVSREAREAVEALAAGLNEQVTGMLEAGNGVILDHNEAMGALETGFAVDAVEALGDALSPVAEALSAVNNSVRSRQAELSQKVQATIARLEELAPEIGALSERLLRAKDLREA